MCATRYALMLRFAQTVRAYNTFRGKLNYPKRGWMLWLKDNLRSGAQYAMSMEIIRGASAMVWCSFALPTSTKPRRSVAHRLTHRSNLGERTGRTRQVRRLLDSAGAWVLVEHAPPSGARN